MTLSCLTCLAIALLPVTAKAALTQASSTGFALSGKLSIAGIPAVDTGNLGESTGTAPPAYNKTANLIPLNVSTGAGLLNFSGTATSSARSDMDGQPGLHATSATGQVTNLSLGIASLSIPPLTILPPLIEVSGDLAGSQAEVQGNGSTTITGSSTLTGLKLKISGSAITLPLNPGPNTVVGTDVLGLAGVTVYLNEQVKSAGDEITVTALHLKLEAVNGGSFGLLSGDFRIGVSMARQSISGSSFEGWISGFPSLPGATDQLPSSDPDHDGIPNIVEYALDSDPTRGTAMDHLYSSVARIDGASVFTLTLPVRFDAQLLNSSPPGGELVLQEPGDLIQYHIQVSTDLASWTLATAEVTGANAAAVQTNLPVLDSGWVYRTFRGPGTINGSPRKFMRVVISR